MTGAEWLAALDAAARALDRVNADADAVADLDPLAHASLRQSVRVALDVLRLAARQNAPAIRRCSQP